MSHPAPHPAVLHPYISPNLAQYCRTWMSLLLTSGMAPLLLYTSVDLSTDLHSNRILATPFTMLQWDYITNDHLNHSTKGKISPNLSRTPIKSPKNQFLWNLEQQQNAATKTAANEPSAPPISNTLKRQMSKIPISNSTSCLNHTLSSSNPNKPKSTRLPIIVGEQKHVVITRTDHCSRFVHDSRYFTLIIFHFCYRLLMVNLNWD